MPINPYDQLNEILPDAHDETRRALIAWAGRQAIWRVWQEINLFAQAGARHELDGADDIAAYWAGRLVALAIEMDQLSNPAEPQTPYQTQLQEGSASDQIVLWPLGRPEPA